MSAAVVALAVLRLTLKLDLGPEWDSNANRAEIVKDVMQTDVPQSSFLLRSTVQGQLMWRKGINVLRAGGTLGGKVFFDPAVQDQNTLVGALSLEDRVRPRNWLELGAGLDYYDAGQENACTTVLGNLLCNRHRDFRSGSALARLGFLDDPGSFTLLGGYRGFEWKPDPQFDFNAGQLTAIAALRLYSGLEQEHEFDLAASYHLERRFYLGLADVNNCPPGTLDLSCINTGGPRRDWYHQASVDFTWLWRVLVGVGYTVELNDSNSFGWSLLRHIVSLKVGARLFWQLYLTLKGQLFITKYREQVILGQSNLPMTVSLVNIEDENRNAFIADLERPIGKTGVAVQFRYSLYTNEISSSPVSFLRHVVYLGVSYRLSGPNPR